MRAGLAAAGQGARVGSARRVPRAVDPLRAVRRSAGRPVAVRRAAGGRGVALRGSAVLDGARRRVRDVRTVGGSRCRSCTGRGSRNRRRTRTSCYRSSIRAKAFDTLRGLLPAATGRTSASTERASRTNSCCCGCARRRWARCGRTRTTMLVELRKVIPAFLTRVDRPDRGGAWSEYLARLVSAVRAVAPNCCRRRLRHAARARRGRPHRPRSGGRDQGRRRGALRSARRCRTTSSSNRPGSMSADGRPGSCAPTSAHGRTGATSPAARSSGRRTGSTCCATTGHSATSSGTGCSRSNGSRSRRPRLGAGGAVEPGAPRTTGAA